MVQRLDRDRPPVVAPLSPGMGCGRKPRSNRPSSSPATRPSASCAPDEAEDERIRHQAAWRLIYQRIEMARLAVKIAAQVPFLTTPAASRVEPHSDGLTNEQRAQSIINVLEPIIGTQIPLPQLLAHFGP